MVSRLEAVIGRRAVAVPETCRRGFSLLELMIVLAILVSLAALTLPNLQRQFQRNELREAGRRLQETLGELRQEALQSGRPLFVQFGWDSNRLRVFRDASYLAALPRGSEDPRSEAGRGIGPLGPAGFGSGGANASNPLAADRDGSGLSLEPWDVQELTVETDARFAPRRLTSESSVALGGEAGTRGPGSDAVGNGGSESIQAQSTGSSPSVAGQAVTSDDRLGPSPSGWSPPLAVLPDGSVQSISLWLQLDQQWQCPILWRGATGQLDIGPAQRVTEAAPASPAQVTL